MRSFPVRPYRCRYCHRTVQRWDHLCLPSAPPRPPSNASVLASMGSSEHLHVVPGDR